MGAAAPLPESASDDRLVVRDDGLAPGSSLGSADPDADAGRARRRGVDSAALAGGSAASRLAARWRELVAAAGDGGPRGGKARLGLRTGPVAGRLSGGAAGGGTYQALPLDARELQIQIWLRVRVAGTRARSSACKRLIDEPRSGHRAFERRAELGRARRVMRRSSSGRALKAHGRDGMTDLVEILAVKPS